ncbi:RNA polymerase sigma factor [Longimicrobium terrae]|uniref:RNA polymerase sigma factor for flagellar operon FliA n=1 Tax=Longimicrobium terrae TaxID=1639882 RepID=A0A841GZ92_9BACT|nr:sigma-70 family RNA polymerase sigma factor [Longimicrobium terrae]MBB4636875.1 RNA polymerase sigma factor for flagellar operon FliA [Longimicrobium terrae]MBB6071125.1 RNA polymerase sigma factor for flagellar operon FliA [Longimicrobium terrae]NNC29174.1 sigma-70 family RNA polymerase sigma factor [Longimicrobium terrae]
MPPDRLEAEKLFLDNLGYIDRLIDMASRRAGLRGDDADDFAAWIRVRLMDDDYAVIRDFRGTAKLTTYLTTVVNYQSVEYQRLHGGRWRLSAAAQRLGPPAPELERLVYRDGYTIAQAGQLLRTAGRTEKTDTELAHLFKELRIREPLRPEHDSSDMALGSAAASEQADEHVAAAETAAQRVRVLTALQHAMAALDPIDAVIARMHYVDDFTIAAIARTLKLEQKPLYRRLDRVRKQLRSELEAQGIDKESVREILPEGDGA